MTAALAPAWGDLLTAARDVDEHTQCRSDSCGWYVVVPAEYLDALHRCVQQAAAAPSVTCLSCGAPYRQPYLPSCEFQIAATEATR